MLVRYFLYSRSVFNDYRWIVVPSDFAEDDVRRLRSVFSYYESVRPIEATRADSITSLPTLMCIAIGNCYALIKCSRTSLTDGFGRSIFAMQGLVVDNEFKFNFAQALPYLTFHHDVELDVWKKLNIEDIDRIRQPIQIENELTPQSIDIETKSKIQTVDLNWDERADVQFLQYSDEGFFQLLKILLENSSRVTKFAFGVPKTVIKHYERLEIVASLGQDKQDRVDKVNNLDSTKTTNSYRYTSTDGYITLETWNDPVFPDYRCRFVAVYHNKTQIHCTRPLRYMDLDTDMGRKIYDKFISDLQKDGWDIVEIPRDNPRSIVDKYPAWFVAEIRRKTRR